MRALLLLSVALAACKPAPTPTPSPTPVVAQATKRPDPRIDAGGALFAQYCALCHGPDAQGYAADNAPSLQTSTFLETATVPFLRDSIAHGRPGTAMAGYGLDVGGPLTPVQIAQLIAWIRRDAPPLKRLAGKVAGDPARGKALYEAHCASCHGTQDQRGEAPHLANPVFLAAASDAYLRYGIEQGRPGTQMAPKGGADLSAQDLDDLVALLRSWAPPPTPAPSKAPKPVAPHPKDGPVVIHPDGKAPEFTVRDGRYVPVDEVKSALDAGRRMVIVDARAGSDYLRGHIPGSISAAYYETDRIDAIPNDGTWVIAYCACPHHASGEVVDELRKRGFANTAVLDEGILVWQQRGYPMTDPDPSLPPIGFGGHKTPRVPGSAPPAPGMPPVDPGRLPHAH